MAKGYKIGEVSRIYGLSIDAIRYYESRGILSPQRDKESGYRYYSAWDLNYLLECMRYRSYDFSLSDIEQMIVCDGMEQLERRCRKREAEILLAITRQQHILKQLSSLHQRIARIPQELGEFILEDSPEVIWQRQRTNESLETGLSVETVSQWVKQMPFLEHTFLIPLSKAPPEELTDYCWGFSITPENLNWLHMNIPDTTLYIPSRKSIRTVFSAGEEGSFLESAKRQAIEPIKQKGYQISGSPYGNLLVRIHEDGKMKRYFEIWVPIK